MQQAQQTERLRRYRVELRRTFEDGLRFREVSVLSRVVLAEDPETARLTVEQLSGLRHLGDRFYWAMLLEEA